jgi:DNA-binding NarL/FixJ family response regulator
MNKAKIFLLDDHQMLRAMWVRLFSENPELKVVGDSGDIKEAVKMIRRLLPDIVLLDIQLRDASGMDAIPLIKKYSPATAIIVVSLHSEPVIAKKLIKLGARGYVTKNSDPKELFAAIEQVMNGDVYICSEIQNQLGSVPIQYFRGNNLIDNLTKREQHITRLIKKGLSSREISEELDVAIKTVETHRHNILKKLGFKNSLQLVNYIHAEGQKLS